MLDLSTYLVTDSQLLPTGATLESTVEKAIKGGATIIQLREKNLETAPFIARARSILQICHAHHVPLLINDRIDVALAVDADGVHVGQDDISVQDARRLLGPGKILGVTVENVQQALKAIDDGATYVGTSAVFETKTKVHPRGIKPLGFSGVGEILKAVKAVAPALPVVTIGGINAGNVEEVLKGVEEATNGKWRLSGVAVVSAIIAHQDPESAARELASKVRPLVVPVPHAAVDVKEADHLIPYLSQPSAQFVDRVTAALDRIKSSKPLVHSITNYVVMNDNANAVLAVGGSPLMAHSTEEMPAIVSFINALVINIGTLSNPWIEGMHLAAQTASERKIPIILDPVGAGATSYRMKSTTDLLKNHKITILKGNAGEIASIMGSEDAKSRGVDAEGDLKNPENVARELAKRLGVCVAITGVVDYVSDGKTVVRCRNGNDWLGKITGTGCNTSVLVGAFAGVESDPLVAAVGGIVVMGIAAELAVLAKTKDGSSKVSGPMSFKTNLFDSLYHVDSAIVKRMAKVEVLP
ncbi:hypothetical protein HDV05_005792 [Chytridiales sp. JEL 0842]|nr:hypothetical protein HDV05_005792 [Chytridiales sp. JEL 0842]